MQEPASPLCHSCLAFANTSRTVRHACRRDRSTRRPTHSASEDRVVDVEEAERLEALAVADDRRVASSKLEGEAVHSVLWPAGNCAEAKKWPCQRACTVPQRTAGERTTCTVRIEAIDEVAVRGKGTISGPKGIQPSVAGRNGRCHGREGRKTHMRYPVISHDNCTIGSSSPSGFPNQAGKSAPCWTAQPHKLVSLARRDWV